MSTGHTRQPLSPVKYWGFMLPLWFCICPYVVSRASFVSAPLVQGVSFDATPDASVAPQNIIRSIPEGTQYVISHGGGQGEHGTRSDGASLLDEPSYDPFGEVRGALETMQSEFFELWLGDWPATIDWTGAVMGTYISSTLNTLTQTLTYHVYPDETRTPHDVVQGHLLENYINRYFSQTTAYYFGENAFSLRTQAYDDMLWVVLGWLESIKLMNKHTELHYKMSFSSAADTDGPVWHGKQFEPAFAHRSHIFHDLVQRGWDEDLCGGGLTWNPRLRPYKNTITNTLFISASIGMYLYHPGDTNSSPFLSQSFTSQGQGLPDVQPQDPKYLKFAVDGYNWLKQVNLTNDQGLYVDGYHVRNWGRNGSRGTGNCDERNEMVYTYNQGVILSGLRGLWESTGNLTYLQDGHGLIRNVVAATGWSGTPMTTKEQGSGNEETASWGGIGRNGILQEFCDSYGFCSQDAQTFKGIFFHHFTQFCDPLPTKYAFVPGHTYIAKPEEAAMHARSCKEYTAWVARNAKAAMATKNTKGVFGMWWGADSSAMPAELPQGAIDIRNKPWIVDEDRQWTNPDAQETPRYEWQREMRRRRVVGDPLVPLSVVVEEQNEDEVERDWNDRGRGRTVETQGGGLMVVRAWRELLSSYGA